LPKLWLNFSPSVIHWISLVTATLIPYFSPPPQKKKDTRLFCKPQALRIDMALPIEWSVFCEVCLPFGAWKYEWKGIMVVHHRMEECHGSPVWKLRVPPRTRVFGWTLCRGILSARVQDPIWLSTFPSFRMDCKFCSCVESDTHALLEWPVAMRVGANIMVRCRIWTTWFRHKHDCRNLATEEILCDDPIRFVVIVWECWNTRDRYLFNNRLKFEFFWVTKQFHLSVVSEMYKNGERWRLNCCQVYENPLNLGAENEFCWW